MKHLAHFLTTLLVVEVVLGISFNPVFSNRPQLPRGSQLVEIPNNVGLANANGHIAYFGDFNSDKFSDIFIVDSSRTSGSFWLWNSANWQFEQLTSTQFTSEGSQTILDVVATDFNRDGRLDLLVQTGAETGAKNVRLFLYFGNTTHFTDRIELPSAADVVSVIDYNGDLYPDLIGSYTANNATKLSIWLNNKDAATNFTVQDFATPLTLASGSAIGFVDMNGDCMPDLFIPIVGTDGVVSYDVWINGPEQFAHARTIKGIAGLGSPSFADFDGDGTTDILFPYCATSNCTQLIVAYNQQKPVCSTDVTKDCRSLESLCEADDNWAVSDISATPSATLTVIDLAAPLSTSPHFPARVVRVGDVDLDGYPDLLISIVDPSSGARRIALYHNVPCTGDLKCVDAAVSAKRRAFTELTQGTNALVNLRGAFAAAFFDLDDDGTNDILVLAESDAPASSVTRNISALFNNYDNDAYFLKMIALSGVCMNWCDGATPDPKPYGVNQHGAIFKWTATDLDNIRRVVQVSQLTQSSHLALQPPYFFGGLGRPSNYVDYLYMGVSVRNKDKGSSMFWSGLIPNSQVVTIPYPPDEPTSWTAELYVSPGSYVAWIAIAVVAWLVVVGVVIIILQVREKQEDNKAKKEREHLFSFKAL